MLARARFLRASAASRGRATLLLSAGVRSQEGGVLARGQRSYAMLRLSAVLVCLGFRR